jgi:hypothetical protein
MDKIIENLEIFALEDSNMKYAKRECKTGRKKRESAKKSKNKNRN